MISDRLLLPLSQAQRPLYAGVDLGGTNIKAALVDDTGRLIAFHTEKTHAERGPEDAAGALSTLGDGHNGKDALCPTRGLMNLVSSTTEAPPTVT